MVYTINKQIRHSEHLRKSFFDLAYATFAISFEDWYANGYWDDHYIPYALVYKNQVVANASVTILHTTWQNEKKKYIQIGTVMCAPAFRNRGYVRILLDEIIADWKDQSDAIYLYANDSVLDFYPKFGFQQAQEYQYFMPISSHASDFIKLKMTEPKHQKRLLHCYRKNNPFTDLPFLDNEGLLMFYCMGYMKDCIYYSKQHATICIAQFDGETLFCHDLFGAPSTDLTTILPDLALPQTKKVVLGFTPKQKEQYLCQAITQDDVLFVYENKENIFKKNQVMMPVLSHA